ncbi:hypothetical protein [Melissospora conviva]|uniref:hypothetical protein n=1 Tax=Melissospora conviva TaxID=3388432 RepID=UPI003C23EEA7
MTSDRLTELAAQYRAAKRRHQNARRAVAGALADMRRIQPELAAEIVAEAGRGTRPKEIIAATGYTAERVRQILRDGGVPPADSPPPAD